MRFWDASAAIPLLVEEATSEAMNSLLREGREIVVRWGTWAECTVAIGRFVRENTLDEDDEARVRFALGLFAITWTEVKPTSDIRSLIEILSRDHPRKAADIFQPNQLRRSAESEGFVVLPE